MSQCFLFTMHYIETEAVNGSAPPSALETLMLGMPPPYYTPQSFPPQAVGAVLTCTGFNNSIPLRLETLILIDWYDAPEMTANLFFW